jgi:predicted phage terminase large subunit-like protein
MMRANPKWERANHLERLNEELLDIFYGANSRLMVFMPPGHGKSSLISDTLPAWWLMRRPDDRIIFVTYEHRFAAEHGRQCRELFREYAPPIVGLQLDDEKQSADEWNVKGHRGKMWSVGVGGPITGKRANLIIIDDPIKNEEEANSQVYREKAHRWYDTTLRTRLEPNGAIVVVETRWHEDDLAGRLIEAQSQGGDKWKIISLPAIAEENDPIGRSVGEPLWPSRFPLSVLEQTRKASRSATWAALYQQRPAPDSGDIFKREYFRYFDIRTQIYNDGSQKRDNSQLTDEQKHDLRIQYVLHDKGQIKTWWAHQCTILQTVDTSATEKETSDYFVILTFALTPDREILILDVLRTKAETTKHIDLLMASREKWRPRYQAIESVSFGLSLIQQAKRIGLPVKPLKADRDKVARSRTVAARYETGTVYHLSHAPFLHELEPELLTFPHGKHDDVVDTVAYAGILAGENVRPRVIALR